MFPQHERRPKQRQSVYHYGTTIFGKTFDLQHQPREQTVKHVHLNEREQAVVADEFHHHKGGAENAETVKQSHTTSMPCDSATMLGKDAAGGGVPITSCEREAAKQDARRD